MSSASRRVEREAQWEAEYLKRCEEEARKESLSMFDRIEESDATADVKDILRRMAEKIGFDY